MEQKIAIVNAGKIKKNRPEIVSSLNLSLRLLR